MDNSVSYQDNEGNKVQELLMPYSEEDREVNEINKSNADLIWRQKYLTIDTSIFKLGLKPFQVLLYSFISQFFTEGASQRFYFTNQQLIDKFNVSEDIITSTIKSLSDLSLIDISYKIRAGGGKIRFVNLPESRFRQIPIPNPPNPDSESGKSRYRCIEDKLFRGKEPKLRKIPETLPPPTLEMVKEYVVSRIYSPVNPEQFLDWYNTAGWVDKNGKPVRNWKLKFISWENTEMAKNPDARRSKETFEHYHLRTSKS